MNTDKITCDQAKKRHHVEQTVHKNMMDYVKKCSDFDLLDLYTEVESECQKRDLMG